MTNAHDLNLLQQAGELPADDASLVRGAAAGDRASMERLLMRAQSAAFRFSVLVCGHADDAEDVMQEALLKTYRYVDRIRDPAAFRPWLYRTVKNACLMSRRKRKGEPTRHVSLEQGDGREGAPFDVVDPGRGPEDIASNAWLGERLQAALQALAPTYRVVLVLREIEGLTTREVAKVLKISEDNVKTRLHRARISLRRALETA